MSNKAGQLPYSLYAYDSYGAETGGEGDPTLSSYKGYDKGPFGYKTGVRQYDPETGRFLSPDPFKGYMKEPPSQHPYMYCRGNPISYSDPSGYDYLVYDGKFIAWRDDRGLLMGFYYAYSGKYPSMKDRIPEGKYTINPKEIGDARKLGLNQDAWGSYRVQIRQGFLKEKLYTKLRIGRGEYFLHGGYSPGTAGCIEVAEYGQSQKQLRVLMDRLKSYGKEIKLTVKYSYSGSNWDPNDPQQNPSWIFDVVR